MPTKDFKLVMCSLVFLMACQERQQLREMHDSTGEMNKTTQSMDRTMQEMNQTMKTMNQTMSGMSNTMNNMDGTMGGMHGTMVGMDNKMGSMGKTMTGMNGTMINMAGTMDGMAGTMDGMNNTMEGMANTMGDMNGTMGGMDNKMGTMGKTMGEMNGTMNTMNGTMGSMNQQLGAMDSKMGSLVQKIDAMDGKMGNLVEQITGMNKTLLELGSDMKAMSGKLDGMSAKMGDLLGKMNEIYDVARPGLAMILRDQSFARIKSNKGLPAKISAAAKYYMSFEYQVFQENGTEGQRKRLELANAAVAEFLREIKALLPKNQPQDKVMSFTGANEEIEALAVAMHRVNEIQEAWIAREPSVKKLSMLSLMIDGLKSAREVGGDSAFGDAHPEYLKTVLVDRELALWLLKIRMNTLVKLTLGRVSPLTTGTMGVFKTFGFVRWDLRPSQQEIAMLEEINRYLMGAVQTKQTLVALGQKPELPTLLRAGLLNMNLDQSNEGANTIAPLDPQRQALVTALAKARQELLADGASAPSEVSVQQK